MPFVRLPVLSLATLASITAMAIGCSSDPTTDGGGNALPSVGAPSGETPGAPSGTTPGSSMGSGTGTGTGSNDPKPGNSPPTCGGGGGPNGGPTDMFPCDSPWYKDVSALPAYTAQNIPSAIGGWGDSNHFRIDFSIVYLHADASTQRHDFQLDSDYDPDNDHDAVPVPATGAVEGESGYSCTQGGDCHLIVVDDSTHKLFELWQATNQSGTWKATQETVWDLTKHYGENARGLGCTSADAAGLPILPGLIGVREVAAGEIKHALRFILPQNKIRKNGFVAPATHSTDSYSGGASSPPMGTRMRLKPSFQVENLPSQGAKVVARALQKYGMILADAGQDALTAESDEFETTKWDGLLGGTDLESIRVADFEVVDFGTVHTPSSMDCMRE